MRRHGKPPTAIRHHPNTRMRIDRLGRQGLSRRWATHVGRSRPPSWVINVHSGKGVFTRPGPETEVAVSQMRIGGSSRKGSYLVGSLSYRGAIRRLFGVLAMPFLLFMRLIFFPYSPTFFLGVPSRPSSFSG